MPAAYKLAQPSPTKHILSNPKLSVNVYVDTSWATSYYGLTVQEGKKVMKRKFRDLRLNQLSNSMTTFAAAKSVVRPHRGWLRAIREATGMSLRQIAEKMKATPQLVASLEKSEANNRITLHSLQMAADAMGCELVYAIVPKSGALSELAESRDRQEAEEQVRAVEHTMMLENQAVGGVDKKIAEELNLRLKGR